jgi:uncharacterized protein YacL (UPF0231 family)
MSHEFSSIGRNITFYMQGAEVRVSAIQLIHLMDENFSD